MLKNWFQKESNRDKLVPWFSVLLGFFVGAIVILISGHNPFEAYGSMLKGAGMFGDVKKFGNTLLQMTSLILTGLSLAFAFRTGLFNIGASGQVLMGGFAAVFIGIKYDLPQYIHMPLAVLAAGIAGALWALLPAILKARYKIHEVVTTIMMNWIAVWSVYYFVPTLIPGAFDTESSKIKETASLRLPWLTELFKGSAVNLGLFIAIFAAIAVWFILEKTTFGYELKAVGFNTFAAKYAGMKVNRNIIASMMISGLLAGLAGATYYIGYSDNIKIGVLPSLGFDGMAVALLGQSTPIGVVLSAFLFGMMSAGKEIMQLQANVPNELVPIIIAVIIFFAAANLMIKEWLKKVAEMSQAKTNKVGGKND